MKSFPSTLFKKSPPTRAQVNIIKTIFEADLIISPIYIIIPLTLLVKWVIPIRKAPLNIRKGSPNYLSRVLKNTKICRERLTIVCIRTVSAFRGLCRYVEHTNSRSFSDRNEICLARATVCLILKPPFFK